jgi:hypothetical protein
MSVNNIWLEFQMEIGQRHAVSYLHRKGMKLPAIVAEPAAVYHEDAFDESRMKYWLHQIKLHRSHLSDRASSGRPPLEDINARILQILEVESWSSLRTIAEFFKIFASTVHLHLTTSLPIQVIYYKCLMSRLLSLSKWHLIKNLIEEYSC